MTQTQLDEMKRIIESYIPMGNDYSLCHVGICSIKRCERCQSASKIRELILELEVCGHVGR